MQSMHRRFARNGGGEGGGGGGFGFAAAFFAAHAAHSSRPPVFAPHRMHSLFALRSRRYARCHSVFRSLHCLHRRIPGAGSPPHSVQSPRRRYESRVRTVLFCLSRQAWQWAVPRPPRGCLHRTHRPFCFAWTRLRRR